MRKRTFAFILALSCSVLTSLAQILFKRSSVDILKPTISWILILGFLFYIAAAIILIIALRYSEVSKVYPVLALSFAQVYLLSGLLLAEPTSTIGWIGIGSIIGGVIFLNL